MSKAGIICIGIVSFTGISVIGGLAIFAMSKGIDGMVLAGAFGVIGAIVGVAGTYLGKRLKVKK